MAAHIRGYPPESPRIVERSGQLFRFLEIAPDRREVVQREERLTKVETKIDRALELLARVGERMQGGQSLPEAACRLAVGRMGQRLRAGLSEVRHRLVPEFALEGVVRQALYLVSQTIRVERLERHHDSGMKCASAVGEHA